MFGMKIEIAGLLIAITDMVINFTGISLSSAVLIYQACSKIKCRIPVTEAIAKEAHRQYTFTGQHEQAPSPVGEDDFKKIDEKELSEIIEEEFWPLLFFILLCLTQVIFNSLLIHGIRKEDIRKVKLWLVFKACIVLVGIFLILTQDSIGQGVYRQIFEILYVFLTLFFMCTVFILYDVMHRRRSRSRNNNGSCVGRLIQN